MIRLFTSPTQATGEIGETQAVHFLRKQGFSIIARNVANKYGEIDIIGKKQGIYYFFEVKTGKQGGFINPAENLTKEKLRKFFISVEHYCLMNRIQSYRVQGILILLPQNNEREAHIEIIDLS